MTLAPVDVTINDVLPPTVMKPLPFGAVIPIVLVPLWIDVTSMLPTAMLASVTPSDVYTAKVLEPLSLSCKVPK